MRGTLFIVLLAAMLVVACSGKTAVEQPTAQQEGAAQQPSAGAADAGTPSAGTPTADKPAAMPAKDEGGEFRSLLGKKSSLQYKISYDSVVTAAGTTERYTMTQYLKGETKFRTDMTPQGMETRMYLVDETIAMCTKATGEWMCLDVPYNKSESDKIEDGVMNDGENYRTESEPSRTIAGESASCYKVTVLSGEGAGSVAHYCLASDGLPLYIGMDSVSASTDVTAKTEMTATSVSRSVSDSDFVPPAKPGAMPGLPAGVPSEYIPKGYDVPMG